MARTRYFRTDAGWIRAITGSGGDEFTTPMDSHEADLSAFYGEPVTGVEQDAEEADPRSGEYVAEPLTEDAPAPEPDRLAQLEARMEAIAAYAGVPAEVVEGAKP